MCLNKVRFETILEVYRFIARRKREGRPLNDTARPYKCPFCKKLHISSKPVIKQESSPEYLAKILKLQGFDGDFAERFINHASGSRA